MRIFWSGIVLCVWAGLSWADDVSSGRSEAWLADHGYFAEELWPSVGAAQCLACHVEGGAASGTRFVLRNPNRLSGADRAAAFETNQAAFRTAASLKEGPDWLALLKVSGAVSHGGGEVLPRGSVGFRILERWVHAVNGILPPEAEALEAVGDERPFFESVEMIDDRRLLRRLTLSLAARLPTADELASVRADGLEALDQILDRLMTEEAFYERLAEGFNDILLTRGYEGAAQNALSYEHFSTTRNWPFDVDFTSAGGEAEQRKARRKTFGQYQEAMLREPTELIKHIVRHDRPFTEIVTADYVMLSPYTARGYGVFDWMRENFEDPEDPFEFLPVAIPALKSGSGLYDQRSKTGLYPHAGILSSFQYLMRYPTTETNRNRLRARMFYQHFLGVDVMELAPRVNDAAAIAVQYKKPTMEAPDCVVCHRSVDPVAGLFQEYYMIDGKGVYGPRTRGWFKDMFGPGFEGEPLPRKESWRALQWLGEHTAQDPRFAVTMVGHVYFILSGRRPLSSPTDLSDPLRGAKKRAYEEQSDEFEAIARRFADGGYNLRSVFKDLSRSRFYRAEALSEGVLDAYRRAELADVGLAHLLTPEQLQRKFRATLGEGWSRFDGSRLRMMYGGIDSREVTERIADPNGAMGSIQKMAANAMACLSVPADFARPAEERNFFRLVDTATLPGNSADADLSIRRTISSLHWRLLGRLDGPESAEVSRTFELFADVIKAAQAKPGWPGQDIYLCRDPEQGRIPDPHYAVRAWRAVFAYLMRRYEFLYE